MRTKLLTMVAIATLLLGCDENFSSEIKPTPPGSPIGFVTTSVPMMPTVLVEPNSSPIINLSNLKSYAVVELTPSITTMYSGVVALTDSNRKYIRRVVAASHYVFWRQDMFNGDTVEPTSETLYGYDLNTKSKFVATEGNKLIWEIASDGKTLVWLEENYNPLKDCKIQGYDLEARKIYTIRQGCIDDFGSNTVADGVVYYNDNNYNAVTKSCRHCGIFAYNLATGQEKQIDEENGGIDFVRNGVILWHQTDFGYHGTSERISYHLLLSDGTLLYNFADSVGYLSSGGISGDYVLFNYSGSTSDGADDECNCVLAYDISKREIKRIEVMGANAKAWNGLLVWQPSTDTIAYDDVVSNTGARIQASSLTGDEAFNIQTDKAAISDSAFVRTDSWYHPQTLYLVPLK